MSDSPTSFVPLTFKRQSAQEMLDNATSFESEMSRRRSVREFSPEPVDKKLIEAAIRTASSAPSGANKQPWHFVCVSSSEVKRQIRIAAEREEQKNYEGRMGDRWLADIGHLGTSANKSYLEVVPWIVVLFEQTYQLKDGEQSKNYYVKESVGLAAGLFISALHKMGLCTLTHTPSPMGFLRDILGRPKHERPFILFPIGFPAEDAKVPNICRKPLEAITSWHE